MITLREARESLAARGVIVSRSNFVRLARTGHIPGAELTDTLVGQVWLVPADVIANFQPPGRGWPKGKPRKVASAKSPAKRARKRAA